ncbi:Serine hydrolase-like 2 S homeolog [Oopsacas minuta]|uniref:Serine hydrolase-like 2 S homeolog n=1 Tax=Oopsacas minuta TaxID=111878 RepID=A0AAV7KE10_9METZ|nr:Serine hydrolase-like 2 S homeolog [Oopsacas minuta]
MATLTNPDVTIPNTQEVSFKLPWGIIAGKLWGNPDSEKKILAIHGWLENAGSFDRLAPLLFANELFTQKYSMLAIDLAGHGLSSHRGDGVPYIIMHYAMDIKLVLNQLGWKKLTIFGHSLGGAISSLLAIGISDQIENFITIDAFTPLGIRADQYLNRLKDAVESASTLYSIPDGFKTYPTEEAIIQRILEGNEKLNVEAAKVLAIRGAKPVENGFTFTRDIRIKAGSSIYFLGNSYLEFIQEVLKHIFVPTICIIPNESHMKLTEMISELKFPENYSNKFVSGNHHVHTNNPEVVAPVILEFLNLVSQC